MLFTSAAIASCSSSWEEYGKESGPVVPTLSANFATSYWSVTAGALWRTSSCSAIAYDIGVSDALLMSKVTSALSKPNPTSPTASKAASSGSYNGDVGSRNAAARSTRPASALYALPTSLSPNVSPSSAWERTPFAPAGTSSPPRASATYVSSGRVDALTPLMAPPSTAPLAVSSDDVERTFAKPSAGDASPICSYFRSDAGDPCV